MEPILSPREIQNKRFGRILSILIHLAILMLLVLPLLTYPDPPPGAEGIRVNLGFINEGEGNENAAAPAETPQERTPQEAPEEQEEKEEQVEASPAVPEKTEPEPVVEPEIVRTEDPEAVALKKQQEEDRKKKAAEEQARQEAEEKARKAAAEKAKKEAEDAKKTKDEIAALFGSGKGNTGKPGNQGDPNGDPDASKLEGISTGTGTVGGGLGDRGVMSAPGLTDSSQKQGTVVVRVCVDKTGKVIEAEFTQRGSTTADLTLKKLAVDNAKQWRFAAGAVDKQCGTITYRFVVR